MKVLYLTITLLLANIAIAQTTHFSGHITDNRRRPLIGASISLKGTYDGATSDSAGNYKFSTTEKDSLTLVVSSLGYTTVEQKFLLSGKPVVFDSALK